MIYLPPLAMPASIILYAGRALCAPLKVGNLPGDWCHWRATEGLRGKGT